MVDKLRTKHLRSATATSVNRLTKDYKTNTEDEIITAVFRVRKPGNFKNVLTSKDDMTATELKLFAQSYLLEKSSAELFLELMKTKQHENETPQQFLHRMMGLKQKVIFIS